MCFRSVAFVRNVPRSQLYCRVPYKRLVSDTATHTSIIGKFEKCIRSLYVHFANINFILQEPASDVFVTEEMSLFSVVSLLQKLLLVTVLTLDTSSLNYFIVLPLGAQMHTRRDSHGICAKLPILYVTRTFW